MKKILPIFLVIFVILSGVFAGMWNYERTNKDDLALLCRAGASSAAQSFEQYKETGKEHYWNSAVADFNSCIKAYDLLTEDTNKEGNFLACNAVYGYLILAPEKAQKHIDELFEIMTLISENEMNENAYNKMFSLRNALENE